MTPRFLSLFDVLSIHEDVIREFGGTGGLRDLGLLKAALAAPAAGSGDRYFHDFPFEMAAAYAYHLAQNHPFVDGNKRVAFAVALTFLELNGYAVMGGEDELEAAIWEVASGKMDRKTLSELLGRIYRMFKAS
jgi:death-on-curing protein